MSNEDFKTRFSTTDITVSAGTFGKVDPKFEYNDKNMNNKSIYYKNPVNLFGSTNTSNLLWIRLNAIPINRLSSNVRAPLAFTNEFKGGQTNTLTTYKELAELDIEGQQYYFEFLAPPELSESLSHTWEPYDSVQSQLAGFMAKTGAGLKQIASMLGLKEGEDTIKNILKQAGISISNVKDKLKQSDNKINTFINELSKVTTAGTVQNYRVDTPLQYKNSERRQWEFTFNLINDTEDNNETVVVEPVKILEMTSCPTYKETSDVSNNTEIGLPYLYSITTLPQNVDGTTYPLIDCDLAVLKTVQPTWRGPWIKGFPSRCELKLSFTEYRPLERRLIYGIDREGKGKVDYVGVD